MSTDKKFDYDFNRAFLLKTTSVYKKIAGIIWCIGAIIILEFLLNERPFALSSRMFLDYYVWTIPFFILFQDREFAYKTFSNRKWVWIAPYVINSLFLVLHLIARSNALQTDFGFPPLVRECCCTFFWIMSLPLTIIKKDSIWTIYAIAVYVNSILYYWILMTASEKVGESSGYIVINVIVILMSYLISMVIFYYNFRQIIKRGIRKHKYD